ncbi:MAG: MBL fold metallo-hydrolase, partial [Anaerolineae bacterium]|nr:MBL fold metallo-hydrolase [Anaerolineae bacterium]
PYYRMGVRMHVQPEDEIGPQLRQIGIEPRDVRWLVLTHLHTDHAGGLHHFPEAEILVTPAEYRAASGLNGRLSGYLPQRWPHWFLPTLVEFSDPAVGSFPNSFTLTRAGDVHLVPAAGHTPGQMAVILEEGPHRILIAGDISYTQQTMLDQVVDGVAPDPQAAAQTLARTLAYVQSHPTVYLPSHDPDSAVRLAHRQIIQTQHEEVFA